MYSTDAAQANTATRHVSLAGDFLAKPIYRELAAPPDLTDLRLSDKKVELLKPGLEDMGHSVEQAFIEDLLEEEKYHFTQINTGEISRLLIYIEDGILKNPIKQNRKALSEVRDVFIRKIHGSFTIYTFHDKGPNAIFKNMMEHDWPQDYGISCKFVALSEVDDLEGMSETHRTRTLIRMFDLDATHTQRKEKLDPSALRHAEMKAIATILSRLGEFQDSTSRHTFITVQAGLDELSGNFSFEGKPRTLAFQLIDELLDMEKLGSLLRTICELEELSPKNKAFIEGLFQTYSLE